ncbi:RICIN domain-containing protein [Streptomyces longispororuber]|uniref:RICIN domain-containing protein n=1 Tax=Streptomyces longispororuber TaxID=68230 RepID=UPI00210ABB3C|nr:ricin-type beta-trefoil lectin domain protein [Streptomyces longispororuber]MCQ4214152.1 RICIN domain-containing protein [Streptomyces longispororuber]
MAVAAVVALVWTLIGLPGWADEPAAPVRATGATPPVACDDEDSPDKGWFQVLYVHRAGEDHTEETRSTIRTAMWDVDQIFEASARRFGHGDSRRLRFVQTADCQVDVKSVSLEGIEANPTLGSLAGRALDAFHKDEGRDETAAQAWSKRHRPVMFMDVSGVDGCGLGTVTSPDSRATLHGGNSWMSWGCSGVGVVSHEVVHAFGTTHCDDTDTQGNDPICRGTDKTPRCDDVLSGVVLDCAKDEFAYFDPRPAAGTRLAEHPDENIARSPFLIKDQPAPAVTARLRNQASGLCLVPGDGDAVVQGDCDGAPAWRRTIGDEGYERFALVGSGRCLTMPSRRTYADGDEKEKVPAVLRPCGAGDDRQDWWAEGSWGPAKDHYELISRATRERVQIADGSTAPGAALTQPGGGDSARFKMLFTGASVRPATGTGTGTGPGTVSGSGSVVRLTSGDGAWCLAAPGGGRAGAVPVPVDCERAGRDLRAGSALKWRTRTAGSGDVQVRTAGRGPVCLQAGPPDAAGEPGVRLVRCRAGAVAQTWRIGGDDGARQLISRATGRCLEVLGGTAERRAALRQRVCRDVDAAQGFGPRRG